MSSNLSAPVQIERGEPAYPAARVAAERVYPHFARDLAGRTTDAAASLPPPETMEAIINGIFWASLRREEGFVPRISIAYVSPEQVPRPLRFERGFRLDAGALAKIAPAVERPGIHLAVWPMGGDLCVWGATRTLPAFCFVLEVVAPGFLVVKHSRGEESGKFVNVAVIQGNSIKIIDQHAAAVPDCPALLTSLLGLESQFAPLGAVSVLIQLAVSMRAHGRGGTLLAVPPDSEVWRESVLHPITYSIAPAFATLAELMQEDLQERRRGAWQGALRRAVDSVGGLTAVDGATVITTSYELLAFGAKILRRPGWSPVGQIILTEPIEGAEATVVDPSELGGTRHLSAAQFAHDQRDALAMVASQDGRFTVFAWSPCEGMVHAHRIESLLV